MDGALKILLLATLILLVSAQTWNNYRSLSNVLQKYINRALEKANKDFGGDRHVAFQSLEGKPNVKKYETDFEGITNSEFAEVLLHRELTEQQSHAFKTKTMNWILGRTMVSNFNVNVRLIVTTCKKASPKAYEHRDECVTRKANTPIIDCLVCKTKDGKELVDCARLREVNKGERKEIRNNCNNYRPGGTTLMLKTSSEYDEKQIGCLGCV